MGINLGLDIGAISLKLAALGKPEDRALLRELCESHPEFRLTELAGEGELLVPGELRHELQPGANGEVTWVARGTQPVRSIGPVEVFALERSG